MAFHNKDIRVQPNMADTNPEINQWGGWLISMFQEVVFHTALRGYCAADLK